MDQPFNHPHPDRPTSPLPRLLKGLGAIGEWIYRQELARRNRAFDRGRGVVTFDLPVISIGNLSVGGTGKTPMVRWVVQQIISSGGLPATAMRGYGGGIDADEAKLYLRQFPGLPLVAKANRTEGLIELLAQRSDITHIVLDDGFQHRRIARGRDIVLIDATRSAWEDRLLPAGWLREPPAALARAHALVVTHIEQATPQQVETIVKLARAVNDKLIITCTSHRWASLALPVSAPRIADDSAASGGVAPGWLAGKEYYVCCAIGNPAPFVAAAMEHAGRPASGSLILPDHDPYSPRTVSRMLEQLRSSGAAVLVTSAKDWAKLARIPAAAWPCQVAVPDLQLTFASAAQSPQSTLDESSFSRWLLSPMKA